jgi:GAF domain-containing protein
MTFSQRTAVLLDSMREVDSLIGQLPPSQAEPIQQRMAGLTSELAALRDNAGELEITVKLLDVIITSKDIDEAVMRSAALIKEWAGVEAIGVRLRVGDDFPYFTTIGFPESFVQKESSLLAIDVHGDRIRDKQGNLVFECMCGNIVSRRFDSSKSFFTERGSFWTNCTSDLLSSTTEEDRLGRTRNHCNHAGYESVALIPLTSGDEIFGLIQLNDSRRDCFTPEMISRLESFAAYVAATLV